MFFEAYHETFPNHSSKHSPTHSWRHFLQRFMIHSLRHFEKYSTKHSSRHFLKYFSEASSSPIYHLIFPFIFQGFFIITLYKRNAKSKQISSIYLLKVTNRNTRTRCEICSKLTIKTPERRH